MVLSKLSLLVLGAAALTGLGAGEPRIANDEPKKKEAKEDASTAYGAYVTSKHAVYTVGEPIDLTFWVLKPEAPFTPILEVRDSQGRLLPEKVVDGKTFATAKIRNKTEDEGDGRIPAGRNYLETISDLRVSYDLSKPGTYTVKFVGAGQGVVWDGTKAPLVSDVLTLQLREKAEAIDRVIPLKEVWAVGIPGTRRMETGFTVDGRPLAPEVRSVDEICRALSHQPLHALAAKGFAVSGADMKALEAAYAVLAEGQKAPLSFDKGEKISLAFFAYPTTDDVYITRIEQRGCVIQVSYRLVPTHLRLLVPRFALMPVPNLPPGTYQVEVRPELDINSEWDRTINWSTCAPRAVARSFAFKVKE